MSWFKKAIHLVKLPLDSKIYNKTVEEQINNIANIATDEFYKYQRNLEHDLEDTDKRKGYMLDEPLYFYDPYEHLDENKEKDNNYNRERQVNIVIAKVPRKDVATYDPKTGTINIYPFAIASRFDIPLDNREEVIDSFKEYIKHELTHAVDPKFQKNNPFKGIEKKEKFNELKEKKELNEEAISYKYHIDTIEFEAFCRQIIERLRNIIKNNPESIEYILEWTQNKIETIPEELSFAANAITDWSIYDDENIKNKRRGDRYSYIQLLKMRIFDELFKNLNPMPESQYAIKRREKIQQNQQQDNNSQRKAHHMSWFTKISRRPWSEIPFTELEDLPNDDPWSTKNKNYPEKSNITTIDSPGMGTNQHNNSEVSGDGESDNKVKDLTSFTDIDSIMYEGQVMDEDTGGKPRPRTTDTGGPYIGDQPMVLGLPDDAAGSFVVNYSPNEKTPQEVATDNFLNFQNRPSRKVQLNGRSVNIV